MNWPETHGPRGRYRYKGMVSNFRMRKCCMFAKRLSELSWPFIIIVGDLVYLHSDEAIFADFEYV